MYSSAFYKCLRNAPKVILPICFESTTDAESTIIPFDGASFQLPNFSTQSLLLAIGSNEQEPTCNTCKMGALKVMPFISMETTTDAGSKITPFDGASFQLQYIIDGWWGLVWLGFMASQPLEVI